MSQGLPSLGRDPTSVLGLAQPHLSDLPTPGLQLRVPSHDVIPEVEEVDDALHVPARRGREVGFLREEPRPLPCGLCPADSHCIWGQISQDLSLGTLPGSF